MNDIRRGVITLLSLRAEWVSYRIMNTEGGMQNSCLFLWMVTYRYISLTCSKYWLQMTYQVCVLAEGRLCIEHQVNHALETSCKAIYWTWLQATPFKSCIMISLICIRDSLIKVWTLTNPALQYIIDVLWQAMKSILNCLLQFFPYLYAYFYKLLF